jgi:hypothetical protein
LAKAFFSLNLISPAEAGAYSKKISTLPLLFNLNDNFSQVAKTPFF